MLLQLGSDRTETGRTAIKASKIIHTLVAEEVKPPALLSSLCCLQRRCRDLGNFPFLQVNPGTPSRHCLHTSRIPLSRGHSAQPGSVLPFLGGKAARDEEGWGCSLGTPPAPSWAQSTAPALNVQRCKLSSHALHHCLLPKSSFMSISQPLLLFRPTCCSRVQNSWIFILLGKGTAQIPTSTGLSLNNEPRFLFPCQSCTFPCEKHSPEWSFQNSVISQAFP